MSKFSGIGGIIIAMVSKQIEFASTNRILRRWRMQNIRVTELIITCESCGNVKKYQVTPKDDPQQIFNNFKCENNCGRHLYSFITVGTVHRVMVPAMQIGYAAMAK